MTTAAQRLAWGLPILLALASCGRQAPPAFERPPALVSSAVAERRDVPVYLDEIGRCVAREVVSIQPEVSGQVTGIHFADGADVRKGDLLVTIDARPYQSQLDAAQASLVQAQASLDLAKIDLERWQSVTDQRAVTKHDLDTKRNAVDVAAAQVKLWEAAADAARLRLDYCTIHAPIDGRAGQRLVDTGNIVSANESTLVVIQRLDPVYADFSITENDLTAVQQHMARGDLKVEVRLPDEPGSPREGALTFLDNAVQPMTGTVKLRATLPNADRRFWPGRFVKVRLVLDTIRDAVLVPAAAIQMSATGPFVYVVKEDGTADLRPVTLGQRQAELVVVAEGLQPGEDVVTAGHLGVTAGGKVRRAEAAAAPAAPAESAAPASAASSEPAAAAPSGAPAAAAVGAAAGSSGTPDASPSGRP